MSELYGKYIQGHRNSNVTSKSSWKAIYTKFGKAGNCHVSIYDREGESIVELQQEDIPTDSQGMHYWHPGCKTGWTFFMTNMKSLFGGVDLRNKNVRLQEMLNA